MFVVRSSCGSARGCCQSGWLLPARSCPKRLMRCSSNPNLSAGYPKDDCSTEQPSLPALSVQVQPDEGHLNCRRSVLAVSATLGSLEAENRRSWPRTERCCSGSQLEQPLQSGWLVADGQPNWSARSRLRLKLAELRLEPDDWSLASARSSSSRSRLAALAARLALVEGTSRTLCAVRGLHWTAGRSRCLLEQPVDWSSLTGRRPVALAARPNVGLQSELGRKRNFGLLHERIAGLNSLLAAGSGRQLSRSWTAAEHQNKQPAKLPVGVRSRCQPVAGSWTLVDPGFVDGMHRCESWLLLELHQRSRLELALRNLELVQEPKSSSEHLQLSATASSRCTPICEVPKFPSEPTSGSRID